jgi:hypothetical protein
MKEAQGNHRIVMSPLAAYLKSTDKRRRHPFYDPYRATLCLRVSLSHPGALSGPGRFERDRDRSPFDPDTHR